MNNLSFVLKLLNYYCLINSLIFLFRFYFECRVLSFFIENYMFYEEIYDVKRYVMFIKILFFNFLVLIVIKKV